jgi:hypothetical protein
LKEEALDRTIWRARFGRGFGLVVRQITKWSFTTGPKPLPKQVPHTVQSSVSIFSFHYPVVSSTSSSSCLHLLPRPSVTSILSSVFPSITCSEGSSYRKRDQSS